MTGRGKVLLVEDNDDFRSILEIYFLRAGFNVITASDGIEGLALFEANPDAIVVTDGHMPRMGGPELIQRIRERAPDTSIILMTSDPYIESKEKMKFRGANVVLSKSGNVFCEVIACINRMTHLHKIAKI